MSEKKLVDKFNRPVKENDIIRMYHFTGSRKKIFYLYKIMRYDNNDGRLKAFDVTEIVTKGEDKAHRCRIDIPNVEYNFEIICGDSYVNDYGEYVTWHDRPKVKSELSLDNQKTTEGQ